MKRLTPEEFLKQNDPAASSPFADPEILRYFESLMQAYADHCEETAWVSVDEGLPESTPNDHHSKFVQVIDISGTMQDVTYYDHRHDCWGNTRWVGKISHWKPLSAPPKQ